MNDGTPDVGFTWGTTEGLCWLRTDAGEYKRIDPAFLDTLMALARGRRQIETLTEPEQAAVTVLFDQEYLREGEPVTELPTPSGITLWPRLLVFGVAFTLLTVYVGYQLLVASTPVPTVVTANTGTVDQLLLSIPVFAGMALVHEAGHYLAARPYFEPSIRLSRLNGVFPALVTTTTDAWRCPRSVRVWISLAGPFFDVLQCLGLAALSLLAVPWAPMLALLPVIEYVRLLFSLNPLVRGDGYWLLVDWFGATNLHSRGIADLKHRQLTARALYALGSVAFTILGVGILVFVIATLIGVV